MSEQKALLRPVLQALAAHPELSSLPKKVVADREFCSPKLARGLKKQFGGKVGRKDAGDREAEEP